MNRKILLVTPEPRIKYYLNRITEGTADVISTEDIQHGLAQLIRYSYHAVAIGPMESVDMLCRVIGIIQDISEVYILCLGIEDNHMKQRAIEAGADMTLSLSTDILDARLRLYALLRRSEKQEIPSRHEVVQMSDLRMDYHLRKAWWNWKEISLTKREYDFLYLLAAGPGRVYTFEQIHQLIWNEHAHGDVKNIVCCMVSRLKRKLIRVSKHPNLDYTDCSVLRTPTIHPQFGFSWGIRPTSSSLRGVS